MVPRTASCTPSRVWTAPAFWGPPSISASSWLDQPVQRVTGGDASPSISKVLERVAIAKSEEVAARLAEITGY